MSRIGRLPIVVPDGITVKIESDNVHVSGPRGALVYPLVRDVFVDQTDQIITVRINQARDRRQNLRALHGLYRQLIANMIQGVSVGFTRQLEMKGTGYRAEVQGSTLVISAGYSHPVRIDAPTGIAFKVEKNTQITVEGINKELVGGVAAKIRAVRKPEPYKGKGIRYAGEVIRLKPGKTAKTSAS